MGQDLKDMAIEELLQGVIIKRRYGNSLDHCRIDCFKTIRKCCFKCVKSFPYDYSNIIQNISSGTRFGASVH